MSITPVTSTPQAGLATDSQSRAGERQNVGKQLRQVLSEQRDSMTRMLSQARQQADESTKASARQRLNLLKEQVKLMRTLMAGLPPKQQKAMAAQLKQMAQELKQLARQLDTGGGDAGVDVSLSTGGLAAAGRNEAGAAEGEDASAAAEAQQLASEARQAEAASTDDGTAAGEEAGSEDAGAAQQADQAAADLSALASGMRNWSPFGEDRLSLSAEDEQLVREILSGLRQMVGMARRADPHDRDARAAEKALQELGRQLGLGASVSVSV
ncbi:hypothetical protein [Laribacter hongkongensis]|uniref:hypothetical protein n=1 Tax=Laribacter hongkongensis TaxID=168471 RepID=UPI0004241765|nr:hypothetical protein [Laribacter hongkongensis]